MSSSGNTPANSSCSVLSEKKKCSLEPVPVSIAINHKEQALRHTMCDYLVKEIGAHYRQG